MPNVSRDVFKQVTFGAGLGLVVFSLMYSSEFKGAKLAKCYNFVAKSHYYMYRHWLVDDVDRTYDIHCLS